MPMKIHYSTETGAACGRVVRRITDKALDVNCGLCMKTPEFKAAEEAALVAKQESFDAQVPHAVSEPWHQPYGKVPMTCRNCAGRLFREADRSCYGHYANWVCAACGNTESRLTETGMSF